jgi:hypothetical protein
VAAGRLTIFCAHARALLSANNPCNSGPHFCTTVAGKFGPDGDDNVGGRREQITVAPKDLAHQPFDPVSSHRVPGFSMHADPQTIPRQRVWRNDDSKPIAPKPSPGAIYALKFSGCFEQMGLGERARKIQSLGRQLFAPFCAPSFNNSLTVASLHADKKSMGAGAFDSGGLEGSFAHNAIPLLEIICLLATGEEADFSAQRLLCPFFDPSAGTYGNTATTTEQERRPKAVNSLFKRGLF